MMRIVTSISIGVLARFVMLYAASRLVCPAITPRECVLLALIMSAVVLAYATVFHYVVDEDEP